MIEAIILFCCVFCIAVGSTAYIANFLESEEQE
jgi:hypothetical protein